MKEPSGLFCSDGKRPDGLTLIPWQRGLSLTWDVTVATTLVDSYISASASSAGATAEMAASRKQAKYAGRPENKPSTPHCLGRTCSSRLLWKLWAQSTNRLCNS